MQTIYRKIIKYLLKFPNTFLINAVIRRLLKRVRHDTVIKSRYGYLIHFSNPASNSIGAIGREVILGRYERDYLRAVAGFIYLGDYVIDVGAYEGYTPLLFSKAVGDKGKVFAIEPNPENVLNLRENVRLNTIENIQIIPKAVGAKPHKGMLYCNGGRGAYSSLTNYPYLGEHAILVDVDTIDNLFHKPEINGKIKLIKIDAEGHEAEILAGATRVIIDNRPIIGFEADVTCWAHQDKSIEVLFGMIERFGYEIYRPTKKGLRPFNLAHYDLYRLRATNLVAIHKSRFYPTNISEID